ncbi:hypothetical protein Ahy_A09g046071 [Arachis hypogaea]|uniref:Protein FAR1-RELATED SEQUENCE n=1 Tax=Arachis hypogaea TaxID=3818 RepID=A0A445BNT2_ARAHY|nr:hypothetical protein Ahy_A09g046071 [Arachis hypogaea]
MLKDIGVWIISKVVLNHSHSYCPNQAEMLKQHRELSMSVCRTIEHNKKAGIRPSKTYQSFVAAAGGHHKSLRRPSYMGSNLSGSPLLGGDEKYIKEREHAFIF